MERASKRAPAVVVLLPLALSIAAFSEGCGSKTAETQSATEGGFIEQTKQQANEAARQANLRTIDSAVDLYYASNGSYPADISQLAPEFLPRIPTDPAGGTYYLTTEGGRPKAAVK